MKSLFTLSKSFLIFTFLISVVLRSNSMGQPVLEWTEVYAWTGNSRDIPVEMVLSDSGYIYIGGQCTEDGIQNYLTLKYDPNGNLLWDKVHSGGGPDHTKLRAIAVDKWGNAVVTGSSCDPDNLNNIYTIKYASSNGYNIWSKEVEPLSEPNADSGWDVDVDSTGNTYVTGWVFAGPWPGTGNDWMTISYQPSGVERWRAQYNGTDSTGDRAVSIDVTPGGVVYYAGFVRMTEGIISVNKLRIVRNDFYGADWAHIYDIGGAMNDLVYTILVKVTKDEDVYVTAQYGDDNWKDVFLIKHDSIGNHEWTRTYNGPDDLEDYPVDLAVDSEGNVLVLCFSQDANNLESLTTLKYSPEGDTLWMKRHQYQYGNVEPKALAIDSDNNVYVLGKEAGFYILKYDSNGNEQWVENYADADYAIDIEVDAQQNIYVTGYGSFVGTVFDIVTIKYSQQTLNIDDNGISHPTQFKLFQNYPNPFNPSTKIKFEIPSQARNDNALVTLKVYGVLGNEVATLFNEDLPGGEYEVEFNANGLTSGVYFYQLKAGSLIETKKMILIK